MEKKRIPKPGEIYNHFKDMPYQIITVATHSETRESMVVYQALYGDFKTYVRPLDMFVSEVDHIKYPDVKQKYRFELRRMPGDELEEPTIQPSEVIKPLDHPLEVIKPSDHPSEEIKPFDRSLEEIEVITRPLVNTLVSSVENPADVSVEKSEASISTKFEVHSNASDVEGVNSILLNFLDAESYSKKLEVITSNRKHMTDRLINDMAVSLDCTVEDGPIDNRIQELIFCLKAMCRFEDRRMR